MAATTPPSPSSPASPPLASNRVTGLLGTRSLWHLHPGVRTGEDLTLGERAADRMRNGMGSWPFVFTFLGFLALWAAVNTFALRSSAWDPYPYILLNLFLSMLAGLQGAILLIAAKRADQISAETALHTLQNTEALKTLIQQNTELTEQVRQLSQDLHDHILTSDGPSAS